MPPPQPTDAELLADAADPAAAFAAFYERHAEAILRFAASRGADAETAADVMAETFSVALQQRRRYEPKHETARLWLLGIAVRKLADARRSEARETRRLARIAEHARLLSDADREAYAALVQETMALDALLDLPVADRELILARVVEDRSYAELAAAFGLTEPATRKRVSRGLARLRVHLEQAT